MKQGARGLSLVELLVALAIFALVSAAATISLRLATDARGQLDAADLRLAELEAARAILREDFAQLVFRPTRDEFGERFGPTFIGGVETRLRPAVSGERLQLAFVRHGWLNPEFAAPRSSLQFVEYLLKDGALIRRARAYLDDARDQPAVDRVILREPGDVAFEFLGAPIADINADWLVGWPTPGLAQPFPLAVAMTADLGRFGPVRQIFWIGQMGIDPETNALEAEEDAGENPPEEDEDSDQSEDPQTGDEPAEGGR